LINAEPVAREVSGRRCGVRGGTSSRPLAFSGHRAVERATSPFLGIALDALTVKPGTREKAVRSSGAYAERLADFVLADARST